MMGAESALALSGQLPHQQQQQQQWLITELAGGVGIIRHRLSSVVSPSISR